MKPFSKNIQLSLSVFTSNLRIQLFLIKCDILQNVSLNFFETLLANFISKNAMYSGKSSGRS